MIVQGRSILQGRSIPHGRNVSRSISHGRNISHEVFPGSVCGRMETEYEDSGQGNGSHLPVGGVYASMVEKTGFAAGDVVWHKIFGRGVIRKVDTAGQVYEIQFDQIASIRRIQFRAELRTEEWKID